MAHLQSSPSHPSIYGSTKYDVFLSCRTEDTLEFTSLLCEALRNRGIRHTFNDCGVANEITPALEEAIQTSRVAIIVLSKNFASSSFCLDRLSKILELHHSKFKGKVLPVFYHVDPDDVQMLREAYGEAMAKHKEWFEPDRLHKWATALQQVANLPLPRWYHGLGNKVEYDDDLYIWKIVEEVYHNIDYIPVRVAEYPVGLESRVRKVIQLLDLESGSGGGGVHMNMIGIYGIPGIGKTTLARAVYNSIANQFGLACFLHDVREISNRHGLVSLQEILLQKIVGVDEEDLTCLSEGITEIKRRLCGKKVLLILDDVNKLEQLQALAGSPNWFGLGSRVIITTQNQHLLVSHGIERRYKVDELNEKEALDLLTWNIFKNNKVDSSYMDLLNHAITVASGNPMQLEVIGSALYGRKVAKWKNVLSQFERIQHKDIHRILKQSFDDLETMEQCVFLDIACCFKGYPLVEIQYKLRAHYSYCVTDYIKALIDKSLINISPTGELTLQDNIQNMGKEIVRQESPKRPWKRSRLCIPEEILHVLQNRKGIDKIETICLDLSSTKEEEIDWDGEGFKKMANLKTLIIKNAHFSQAPRHLPTSLRVLEWQRYPSQYLPPSFHPENLTMCKLPKHCFVSSEICGLLNKKSFWQKPVNLVDISFDNGEHSNEMFYVSCLPNSEEITVMAS